MCDRPSAGQRARRTVRESEEKARDLAPDDWLATPVRTGSLLVRVGAVPEHTNG
jgi:hypothetical protein